MVHQFKLLIGFLCIGLIISGCTTTGYSGGGKINSAAFAGWKKTGSADYFCLPPKCKPFTSASYQTFRLSQQAADELGSPNTSLKTIRDTMAKAISASGIVSVRLEGNVTRTKVKGHHAFAFYTISRQGNATAPGYVIAVPIGRTMHTFLGLADTKAVANSSARKIANAWQP